MNSITFVLLLVVIWMVYTMYQTYIGMQKELREIRLKCMGTTGSKFERSPAEDMKQGMIETLSMLAKVST
jgi:hypothetical protein